MVVMGLFVYGYSGEESIILGQFFTRQGEAWGERDAIPSEPILAQVRQGHDWLDFLGTFTTIRLVVSERALELIKTHRIPESIQWVKVMVADRTYWAMATEGSSEYRVLKEPTSVFHPTYEAHDDAELPPFDLVLDEDTYLVLFSAQLVSQIRELGFTGASFDPIRGL